jgi:hypothetical protein
MIIWREIRSNTNLILEKTHSRNIHLIEIMLVLVNFLSNSLNFKVYKWSYKNLALFKILSANGRASASKIEKMAKHLKILMFFF